MNTPEIKPTTIVAVDLGTTYSSIAWSSSTNPDEVTILRDWPSPEGGERSSRVPTMVTAAGHWGFNIPPDIPDYQVMRWFKLGLYPWAKTAPLQLSAILKASPSPEFSTTMFLRRFLAHAKTKMNFSSLPTDFKYVVTVPVIWANDSKEKMKTAFQTALVRKSEAAAIYALHERAERAARQHDELMLGDTFVVCDAGGGTVDLITYTITNVKPLRVEEVVPADGDDAGSTQVDMEFQSYLYNSLSCTKRIFNGDGRTHEFRIKLGCNDERAGVRNGVMKVDSAALENIFKPVVRAIVNQVKQQMRLSPNPFRAYILVGGFAGSPYLHRALFKAAQEAPDSQTDIDFTLIRPPEPELATTRGAVLKGLSLVGGGRLTKVHIVSQNKPASFPFYNKQRVEDGWFKEVRKKIEVDWNEERSVAPLEKDDTLGTPCTLTADVSKLPETARPERMGADGNMYYVSDGEIQVTPRSAGMEYVLYIEGKRYDDIEVKYEYT
ncbi:hypothetical protein QBC41DRAFT_379811 [Cercophora samala]|uniref:Uncharacterized protein n=1 Tax=Cercophora samala TaxID=330535 RepID=A0AA39Z7V4_9PEZI|nr:hypothetical protein QBC41DRAFT_379811 [Cercophora samala]